MAVICGMVVGFAGLIAALFAFFSINFGGAGVCLGASALAFGPMANASWRQ